MALSTADSVDLLARPPRGQLSRCIHRDETNKDAIVQTRKRDGGTPLGGLHSNTQRASSVTEANSAERTLAKIAILPRVSLNAVHI